MIDSQFLIIKKNVKTQQNATVTNVRFRISFSEMLVLFLYFGDGKKILVSNTFSTMEFSKFWQN